MSAIIKADAWLAADDMEGAPPPFTAGGKTIVPVNFLTVHLTITVDINRSSAVGQAKIMLQPSQRGYPLLDLVPQASSVRLDGQALTPADLLSVSPPDNEAVVRVVNRELDAQSPHELIIEYALSNNTVSFSAGAARIGFFMTDLEMRGYLERHAPANLEFDQTPLTVGIQLNGATQPHHLFANGQVTQNNSQNWSIQFPNYFTCSSCYLHLTNNPGFVHTGNYQGLERIIPITAYGANDNQARNAIIQASAVLSELEAAYGPYAHEKLLIYLTPGGGGMEYCGATMTSTGALEHEITHSWFARGVMPANGNAGWIDEATARWRDNGYPSFAPRLRDPVNLAGFSPYRRHTTMNAYALGSLLLSELDFEDKAEGGQGMKAILKELFLQKRRQLITTPYFQSFLEQHATPQLAAKIPAIFARYVYGRAEDDTEYDSSAVAPGEAEQKRKDETGNKQLSVLDIVRESWQLSALAPVPLPYTNEELKQLL